MSRIEETFVRLRARGEKALAGFVTAGDPNLDRSIEIVRCMCSSGLDILELGVPFSDPTADGPVIQRSSARAIAAGVNLNSVIEMVRCVRGFTSIPIVIFSYYNPILAYGSEAFYSDAVTAGVDGALVVDLPPEESDELTCAWGNMLDFIRLVAPTTSQGRMARIAAKASGFIYLVSMTGTTGSDGLNLKEIKDVAIGLRRNCNGLPICIGFGISTPEDAAKLSEFADGIVVGSAFERLIESGLHSEITPERVGELVARLKLAIH